MTFIERITEATNPFIKLEHELRYGAAVPILIESPAWCDLGAGEGVAAATVLPLDFSGRVLLVDRSEDALREAQRRLEYLSPDTLVVDLSTPGSLTVLRDRLAGAEWDGATITCFEVFEHLDDFEPLLELLRILADERGCTVVMSVPNDAFTGVENPHHLTVWGEAAVEELRRTLDGSVVIAHQLPLQGSQILRTDEPRIVSVEARVVPDIEPSHFILSFGPRAPLLGEGGGLVQTDIAAQRAWERQREAALEYYQGLAQRGGK